MHLIHSCIIPESYLNCIDNAFAGLSRIPLSNSIDIYESIASHPDIFIFQLDERSLILSPSLSSKTVSSIKKAGVHIIKSYSIPRGIYPKTSVLNAARVGKYVFCNLKYIDESIQNSAREGRLELIHINQGYARCSIIPVGRDALITSDKKIAKAAKLAGLKVLLISAGNVLLPKQNHGFIGGATGVMPDGRIVFLGDIEKHPDFYAIKNFLNTHKIKYVDIKGLPLFDGGSLIFI